METFILTITDPEDSPPSITSISPDTVSVAIGKTTNVTVVAVDPDPGDTPTLALVSPPTFVTITDNGNGKATINIEPLASHASASLFLDQHAITVSATSGNLSVEMNFTLNITDDDSDGDGIVDSLDVDDDNDRLIEINNLEDLHNIRYNLAGTSYKTNDNQSGEHEWSPWIGIKGLRTRKGTGL